MFKKIKRKLNNLLIAYKLWSTRREIFNELKRELQVSGIGDKNYFIQDEERQIAEGIIAMKVAINKLVASKDSKSYDKLLKNVDDLIKFAEDNNSKQQNSLLSLRKKLIVFKDKDIKTSSDKEKMIQTRINHYHELHKAKESRNLIREIRKARNSGNLELTKKLESEWKNKYG